MNLSRKTKNLILIGANVLFFSTNQDSFYLEMLWLPIGLGAAVLHYSASENDELSPAYSSKKQG